MSTSVRSGAAGTVAEVEPNGGGDCGQAFQTYALTTDLLGNLDQASGYIERALRIEPRDPQLLQHMAEIKLQKEEYQQALNFAVKSYDIGPRVGEICSRNWRTVSVAREHLNDSNGANDAEARASQCMNTRPKGL